MSMNGSAVSSLTLLLIKKLIYTDTHKKQDPCRNFITCVHEFSRVCPKTGHSSKSSFYFYFQRVSKGTRVHTKTTQIYTYTYNAEITYSVNNLERFYAISLIFKNHNVH